MSRQKIVFYFTPDYKVIDRDFKFKNFPKSYDLNKGLYKFDFDKNDQALIKSASCNSIKSAQESTATLDIAWIYDGEETKDIFFVDDYWEIWDEANDWCHFRGMVRNKPKANTGKNKSVTLELVNAGGWNFSDRSIFYINPILAASFGPEKAVLFENIKSKYGLLGKHAATEAVFTKYSSPNKYLDFMVNDVCNPRISYIRSNYFDGSPAIKEITPEADQQFTDRVILVSRQKSQVEGSIWDALKMWEGHPFCQLFISEGKSNTIIKWRYSRWRDSSGNLCLGDRAEDVNPIRIYADDRENIEDDEFKGVISDNSSETSTGLYNAFFVSPGQTMKSTSSVVQQVSVDPNAQQFILDEDSIIRNGYNPQEVKLPFVPETIAGVSSSELENLKPPQIKKALSDRFKTVGDELLYYTKILKKMFVNYKGSRSGSLLLVNNLPISISKDIEYVERELVSNEPTTTHMSLNKITQYFDPKSPRTVLEYSRGFKSVALGYRD